MLDSPHITRDGGPVPNLNELECLGNEVYANVYRRPKLLEVRFVS
ncbi:MAG: glutaminyl-peptide cyclotransferase [Chitinivibrionia bacterium]|nr:glutaminyl-peptide cyclotransferase [Chitinivibrionia bacterium]